MVDNKNSYTFRKYSRNKDYFKIEKLVIYFFFLVLFIRFVFPTLFGEELLKSIFSFIFLFLILKIGYEFILKDHWKVRNKNYQTWGKGAGAELNVKQTLVTLGRDYKVINDFQTGKGNIDFIIIGPKGLFAIEVKSNYGIISYENEKILINGYEKEHVQLKQIQAETLKLSEILFNRFGKRYFVTGILEFPFGTIDKNYIHSKIHHIWIGGAGFHNYAIKTSQNYLKNEEIESIYDFLRS